VGREEKFFGGDDIMGVWWDGGSLGLRRYTFDEIEEALDGLEDEII
jgi:hypothetical protein